MTAPIPTPTPPDATPAGDLADELRAQGVSEAAVLAVCEARARLIEGLADAEHDSWARWMRYLFGRCNPGAAPGSRAIPAPLVERWHRQSATPYGALSEAERDSDRAEVARILPLIDVYHEELLRIGAAEMERRLKEVSAETMRRLRRFTDDADAAHREGSGTDDDERDERDAGGAAAPAGAPAQAGEA